MFLTPQNTTRLNSEKCSGCCGHTELGRGYSLYLDGRAGTYRDLSCGLPALCLVREVTGGHEEAEEKPVVLLVRPVITHCWATMESRSVQASCPFREHGPYSLSQSGSGASHREKSTPKGSWEASTGSAWRDTLARTRLRTGQRHCRRSGGQLSTLDHLSLLGNEVRYLQPSSAGP